MSDANYSIFEWNHQVQLHLRLNHANQT